MTIDRMPVTARGFHPAGSADPSGFAAMACDEILVHTHDAATGLGEQFDPGGELADRLLRRLFPWHVERFPGHPVAPDQWTALLWANGRINLPGRPGQVGWRWHCAPIADWDG